MQVYNCDYYAYEIHVKCTRNSSSFSQYMIKAQIACRVKYLLNWHIENYYDNIVISLHVKMPGMYLCIIRTGTHLAWSWASCLDAPRGRARRSNTLLWSHWYTQSRVSCHNLNYYTLLPLTRNTLADYSAVETPAA